MNSLGNIIGEDASIFLRTLAFHPDTRGGTTQNLPLLTLAYVLISNLLLLYIFNGPYNNFEGIKDEIPLSSSLKGVDIYGFQSVPMCHGLQAVNFSCIASQYPF